MRMTAVVSKLQPATRAFLDVLATVAALAFLLLILPHAWEYAVEEAVMLTPALEIKNSWRVAAMVVGFGAMALFALTRLVQVGRPRQVALALALTIGLIVLMALLVAAEIGVLLAGVIARYVFHNPLIWSDEQIGRASCRERVCLAV